MADDEMPGHAQGQIVRIDHDVSTYIDKIRGLLARKQRQIEEARQLVEAELRAEEDLMNGDKDRRVVQIEKEKKALVAEEDTLKYFQSKFGIEHKGSSALSSSAARKEDMIVRFDVEGQHIDTLYSTITSVPGFQLPASVNIKDAKAKLGPDEQMPRFFMDKKARYFRMILEFLRANVIPERFEPGKPNSYFTSKADEEQFRREVETFGLTPHMYPKEKTKRPIKKVGEPNEPPWHWEFRCNVNEIGKDRFFTSPDFKYGDDRWRMLFTERCSFLSVYIHNIDAGLKETSWLGLPTVLHIELRNNNPAKSARKTIKHTFTRKSPDIGLNYFMLMEGLRSPQGGFLVMSEPVGISEEAKPEIIFELKIEKPPDNYFGQPVPNAGQRAPPEALQSGSVRRGDPRSVPRGSVPRSQPAGSVQRGASPGASRRR